jgi:hypothetical protein
MVDFYQNYADGIDQGYGTSVDPLQPIGTNGYYQGRGGYGPMNIVSNTPTTASIRFPSTEPLYLSPFSNEDDEAGFHGIQTLQFTFILSQLSRVWSHSRSSSNPNIISSINVSFYQAPELHFTYITPSITQPIPRSLVYNYNNVDSYPTDVASAISPGASFTVDTNNIQLNSIPRRIYVYARRSNSTKNYTTSDTFARIDGISLNWDNRQGLLSGASSDDLYKISAYNGYKASYSQWNKYTGSVLILDVGRDIALTQPDEAPGVLKTLQLQMKVNFTNINPTDAMNFTVYIVVISEGLITIANNTAVLQVGVISKMDVLNARQGLHGETLHQKPRNYYGGSFFKKALGAISKGANQVAKYGPTALRGVSDLGNLASSSTNPLEFGLDVANLGRQYSKELKKGRGLVGGYERIGNGLVGGRMMQKSALKSRMMQGSGLSFEDYEEDEE